jgi:UDP-glucose 4-epimerase
VKLIGKNILVTGGCGYIGSHVTLALIEAGACPIILDNLSGGDIRLVPPGVPFVQGDCGDRSLLSGLARNFELAAVMHFAGKIIVPESMTQPLDYYEANTVKSRTLVAFAAELGLPFVFSSTAAVYGVPSSSAPLEEGQDLKPINPYGRSKLMTEWMLQDASSAHGLRYCALRYFNVAGADAKGRAGQVGKQVTHLLRAASQVALGAQPQLTVFGNDYETADGTCIRDYIHVTDLADAHVRALEALLSGAPSMVLNCGYGAGASVLEIVKAFDEVLQRPLPYTFGPRRAGDPPRLVANATQIQRTLAWTPQHQSLNEMVSSAIAWERRVKDGRIGVS